MACQIGDLAGKTWLHSLSCPSRHSRWDGGSMVPGGKTQQSANKMRVAVLGAGKIGSILLQGFIKHGLVLQASAAATVQHPEHARALSRELNLPVTTDNVAAARRADVILIAVKPLVVAEVAAEIRAVLNPHKLVISVA